MAKIVALRGVGDDSVSAPMSPLTLTLWAASLGTVAYIFWATLQPKRKRA